MRAAWFGALGLAVAVAAAPTLFAGDDPAKPEAAAATQPATEATPAAPKSETATPSPVHSILQWVGSQVTGSSECMCPGSPEGEVVWRKWYAGGADIPLAGLRDHMVKAGWNADRTIAFFQEMAKKHAAGGGCCEGKGGDDCSKGAKEGCKCKGTAAAGSAAADPAAAPAPAAASGSASDAAPAKASSCEGGCKNCPCKKSKVGKTGEGTEECAPQGDAKTTP
jgi:hypothetical protein